MEGSPAELVRLAQTGDRRAEALLCTRLTPAVRTFARRRLKGDAIAEFTQDVLLVFVEALRRGAVEDAQRVPGFVLGICRNLARDRAKQSETRKALFEKYGADLAPLVNDGIQEGTYESIHLEDCISQLSRRSRDVLRMSFFDALSHVEMAKVLATSEENARVLRHRLLASLRDCMSKRISWEAA